LYRIVDKPVDVALFEPMIEEDWGYNPLFDGRKLNFGVAP